MKRKQVKKTLSIVLTAAMIGTTNVPVLAADMQPVQEPAVEYGSDAEVPENTDANDVTSEENVSAQDENSENDAEAVEETVVAEASGVQYETLQEAIDSADEVEVKLLKDTTESVTVAAGKTVTLDLNGHKLTNTDKKNTIENNGTLTITDSGNAGTVDNVSHARAAVVNNYDGTVTLKAGIYTRSQEAGTSSSESGDNSYYTLQNLGTMTIEDGVTVNQGADGNGKYSSLVINGKDQSHTSTMTINGGTFNGGLNSVKNDEGGNLTIAGGNFTNIAQHAVLNWEKTVISGGTFEVTDQATALICNGSYEGSAGKIEITGGNFNAGNAAVFMKFSGYVAGTTEKVSGGTFSKDLDASVLAEGYITTKNEDGTYRVEENKNVAEINGTQYESLQEAIDSADTVEVKLLKDTTESVTVAAGKTVTLDLNGHRLTNTDKKNTIENNGTLTITDSGNAGTVDNVSHARAAVVNNYDGTVTLKAGIYTRSQEAGTSSSESGDNSYYTLQNLGTMTIEDGVTVNQGADGNGKYSSLVINGKDQSHTSTMTINGGTFNGGLNSVKNDEGGNLTIAGGNFTNIAQHAVLNWEKTVISGGTFEVTDQATALICNGSYEGSAGKIEITGGNFNAGNAAVFMKFSGYAAGTTEKVSGGTFSKDLDPSVLAEGYTTTENADGTYTVEKETGYQVNVQSRVKGTENTIANVTGGGSDITTKKGTDVTTTVVSGYEFLGWYENYNTSDDIGTLVSTDRTFNYKPKADTTLTAVYKVSEKQTFTLTVGGTGYTVVTSEGSHSEHDNAEFEYAAGTKITVKFNNEDESFLYWMNGSGKIVSTEKEYTFILGSNTTISAVSVAQDEEAANSAYVVFLSESQQVMAAEKYDSNSAIDFPEAPYKMGYEFVKWDKTEAEIKDAMRELDQIRVKPVYKEKENAKYSITVKYDGIEKEDDVYTLQAGNSQYLTAPEVEGVKFQYWKKGNEILSYQSSVTVWGVEDVELTAVYASDIIEKVATVNITGKVADYDSSSGKYKMTFIQNFALGDNNTIVKTGFVYTTKEANAVDDKLVLDGVGIGAGISSLKTKEGSYSYTLKTTNPDLTVYIRAFVQYVDKQGSLQTKYTEIESASYNSIQGGK